MSWYSDRVQRHRVLQTGVEWLLSRGYNNFIPADPLKTPPHIAPVWYFTPFYAILRSPSFAGTQVWGVLAMGAAVVIIAFLPWLDKSPVKSIRYRGPITNWLWRCS